MAHTISPGTLPVGVRTRLGESPWWDGDRLSWIDILGHRIHRCRLDGSELESLTTPAAPGFAIPTADGFVVGLPDGVHRVVDGAWRRTWQAPHDAARLRLNDGKTDPSGRLWFGSMTYDETTPDAALYREDASGVTRVLDGVTTSNGLGWSPAGTTLYYSDSPLRTTWAFDHDPVTGDLSHRRPFAIDPPGQFPDGLTVDADGYVWSAKWQGGRIVRYAPDGRIDTVVEVPVVRPTSLAWVGPDRSTLAVTTAAPQDANLAHELDGAVLLIPTATSGPVLPLPTP